jgi:hypothetical protein
MACPEARGESLPIRGPTACIEERGILGMLGDCWVRSILGFGADAGSRKTV